MQNRKDDYKIGCTRGHSLFCIRHSLFGQPRGNSFVVLAASQSGDVQLARVAGVRRGDHKHIHRLVVEQGAIVIDQLRYPPRPFLHFRTALTAD